jgi:hypothetical protein
VGPRHRSIIDSVLSPPSCMKPVDGRPYAMNGASALGALQSWSNSVAVAEQRSTWGAVRHVSQLTRGTSARKVYSRSAMQVHRDIEGSTPDRTMQHASTRGSSGCTCRLCRQLHASFGCASAKRGCTLSKRRDIGRMRFHCADSCRRWVWAHGVFNGQATAGVVVASRAAIRGSVCIH